MTFSDSRVVDFINENFVPAWEAVSPVRVVTFELGEGRAVKGTVSGEIALYFCSPEGHVFDILPALQSPAVVLESMKKAVAFTQKNKFPCSRDAVNERHHSRMKEIAGFHHDQNEEAGKTPADVYELVSDENGLMHKSQAGALSRDQHISEAMDQATRDLRIMIRSKSISYLLENPDRTPSKEGSKIRLPSAPFIVVEPGGKNYYQWEVARRFLEIGTWQTLIEKSDLAGTEADPPLHQRTPDEWKEELFVHILKQPLDQGQEVSYDSDSLEAIRIIQE